MTMGRSANLSTSQHACCSNSPGSGQSAGTVPRPGSSIHGEARRGDIEAAPQAPLHRGGEAPAGRPESFTRPGAGLAAGVALAALLAGCAAPAPQYYSLQAAPDAAAGRQEARVESAYAISVQPVVVPEQVARPQIVVSGSPGAEVVPLNAALWAGPLEAQIRNALADALARRLNVVDVGQSGAAEGLPLWRIYVDVQRFDSLYGEAVRQDVLWRMVPQGMPRGVKERLCSAQVRVPVGAGMSALVDGHRRALDGLADAVARTLPGASEGAAPVAGAPLPEEVSLRGCVG